MLTNEQQLSYQYADDLYMTTQELIEQGFTPLKIRTNGEGAWQNEKEGKIYFLVVVKDIRMEIGTLLKVHMYEVFDK